MSGKTLIDTSIRNEVLSFLQEVYGTAMTEEQAHKASELYSRLKPKFIKGQRVTPKDGQIAPIIQYHPEFDDPSGT